MGNFDKHRIEQVAKTRKKAHSFYMNVLEYYAQSK